MPDISSGAVKKQDVSLASQKNILPSPQLCNCVGSGHNCCSKFGERGPLFCSTLLVFVWAARTASGVRDSRQTRSLTEQLVSFAKPFPSLRASCLGSKVKDDKHRLELGPASTFKHSENIPCGFLLSRKEILYSFGAFLCTDKRCECHWPHLYLLHTQLIGIICFDLQLEKIMHRLWI